MLPLEPILHFYLYTILIRNSKFPEKVDKLSEAKEKGIMT